jgi:8-oxo-dGTP pyrophosphatase MutT (NUDIX family)
MNDTRPCGAGILVFTGDRYLLQQRGPASRSHQGCWDVTAGGGLSNGEDELDGALREYREEMGAAPELLVTRSVTWVRPLGSAHTGRRYTVFLAWVAGEYEPCPPDKGIVSAWAWVTRSEIEKLPLHPSVAPELAALLGEKG